MFRILILLVLFIGIIYLVYLFLSDKTEKKNKKRKDNSMDTETIVCQTEEGTDIFLSKELCDYYFVHGAKDISVFFKKKNFERVHKGEIIGEIFVLKDVENWAIPGRFEKKNVSTDKNIYAHSDGFLFGIPKGDNVLFSDILYGSTFYNSVSVLKNESTNKICSISDDTKLIVNNELQWKCQISVNHDDFTSKDIIKGNGFTLRFQGETDYFSDIKFTPMYVDNTKLLRCEYDFQVIRTSFNKNDTISFLFVDNTIINRTLSTNPIKDASRSKTKYFDVIITTNDIDSFSNIALRKIRINTKNGEINESKKFTPNEWDNAILQQLTRQLFNNYRTVLESRNLLQIENENEIEALTPIEKNKIETCFVYIMKDEKNGCFKIGISNRPEYREKTLQSDKPFITMLQAKEFPSRKIARAFESALHSTFAEKNIRGEWFDLSSEEVEQVINTLK